MKLKVPNNVGRAIHFEEEPFNPDYFEVNWVLDESEHTDEEKGNVIGSVFAN